MGIPVAIFNLTKKGTLIKIIKEEKKEGTLIVKG